MRTLAIDIETYSSVSLQKCGVYAYAQSPDFEILLFGYAWDDDPVEVIDLARGESLPEELQNALYDPEILKTAFNASFERTCLSAFMGRVTPPEQWSCTAVMARELGLPGSLEAVGEVIGLPEDKQKSKTGRALIRYFSIPCKPTKTNGNRTRNLPEHDPDRWAIYVEYNRQDVVSERAIRQKLSRFPVYEKEQPLWIHDQHINDRGVGVDLNLAEHAVEIDAIIKARLLEQAKELTGLENPKSTAQLKSWIEDTAGIEVESLNKKSIAGVRADADCDAVDRMTQLPHPTIQKFAVINAVIVGASRRFLAQITRHQNEVKFMSASLQYSDYSNEADFVVPYELLDSQMRFSYLSQCQDAMRKYKLLVEYGVDNDSAGYLAPQGLRNVLIISATPYQWKHMISQRTCRRNTAETRYVMLRLWEELYELAPALFSPETTGPFCMKGKCLEGKMACGSPLASDLTPHDILERDFPLCMEVRE